jgi:hypothetical protein
MGIDVWLRRRYAGREEIGEVAPDSSGQLMYLVLLLCLRVHLPQDKGMVLSSTSAFLDMSSPPATVAPCVK